MPVRCTFAGTLFRMDLEGFYAPADITEAFLSALADPAFPHDARFLLDVRRSAELAHRRREDIISVARFFAEHSARVGRRCAIVASEPIHYGLCRMAGAFAEMKGTEVRVFARADEAASWLGAGTDADAPPVPSAEDRLP